MKCVSDKSLSSGATDEWCENNYKQSQLCSGSGCKLEIKEIDEPISYGKNDTPYIIHQRNLSCNE